MPQSIQELRKICQPPHEATFTARVVRYVSIYLTWLLVKTPVTANQVSVMCLVSGIAGAFLLGSSQYVVTIFGVLLLQLSCLLDYSDGEVARYRKKPSMLGTLLDVNFHRIIDGATFAGITYAVFSSYWQNPIVFWFGAIAITFTSLNRSLRANVMRILIEGGQDNVLENYKNVVVSTRKGSQLIKVAEDFLFGYVIFVFIILLLGGLLRRFDVILLYYGVIFPLYYILKTALLWKRLAIN